MVSSISLFEIVNAVIPKTFFWIVASIVDTGVNTNVDAVNPNIINTLLTNILSTFFIKDKPVLSNGLKSLPKNLLIVLFYVIEVLIDLY